MITINEVKQIVSKLALENAMICTLCDLPLPEEQEFIIYQK